MTNAATRVLDTRLLLAIIAAGIMSFSGVVVETAMNVTFPTLMHEFSIGTSLVQWITTGYLLVLALIIPTSAYLKRRFATRTLFTTAIISFLAGTILSAWSPGFYVLLTGRLLQGIGTGIALPLMFNIILEQVPGERLGFMIGVASLITAMAPAVGPAVCSARPSPPSAAGCSISSAPSVRFSLATAPSCSPSSAIAFIPVS